MNIKINLSLLTLFHVFVFISITLNPVFAGEEYSGTRILVGVLPEQPGTETKIDTLINNLLIFEFERYGFIVKKAYLETFESFEPFLSENSDSELFAVCSYIKSGIRVFLDIEIYNVRTNIVVASASTSADITFAFDEEIAIVVSELMSKADEELTKITVNRVKNDLSADIKDITEITVVIPEIEVSVSDDTSKAGLEVFLNTGVTMGVGATSDVLENTGFSLELSAIYWLSTSLGFLGPGGQASANLYPSTGPYGLSSLIMFPIGVSMAYSTLPNRLFSAAVQLGTGPAIAVFTIPKSEPLVDVIPYINGVVLLSLNFRKLMSLGMKTVYSIYFEDTELLTTLTLSIYASFRS